MKVLTPKQVERLLRDALSNTPGASELLLKFMLDTDPEIISNPKFKFERFP
jgi:hypothetical protein